MTTDRLNRTATLGLLLLSVPAAASALSQSIDIPSQPLPAAIEELSAETGLRVIIPTELLEGRTSPRVSGQLTPRQALEALIADTGLTLRESGGISLVERRDGGTVSQAATDVFDLGTLELSFDGIDGFRAVAGSSATNVQAPLIETPATVNVMGSRTLDRIDARDLDDVLHYIPGANPGSAGGAMTNTFNIRGFQSSTTRGGSLGQRANSVFIDGHRPPVRRYHFDRSLYERVEVLKGTSSLLYGTASPGGIVSYLSKRPSFEPSTRISTSLGGFDTRRGSIDVTGPLPGADNFAYRFIGTYHDANQSSTGRNHPDSDDRRLILKPQFAWESGNGTRLDLAYEFSRTEIVADPGILRFDDGTIAFRGPSFVGPDSSTEQNNHIVTGRFEHPLNAGWSVWLSGSHGRNKVDALWDSAVARTPPSRTTLLDRDVISFETDFEHTELRAGLEGEFALGSIGTVATTIGLSYRDESYASDRVQRSLRGSIDPLDPVFAPVGPLGPFTRTIDWEIEEKALYVQNYATIGENLKVFGGLRYTDVETRFNNNGGRDTALDYSLGAIYNHSSAFNPFISYSTSLTPQVGTLASGGPVPFSEGEQFEIGVKSQWFDDRLATSVSVFQIEQTNQVETDPADRSLSIIAGDQRVRGFELEVVGDLTDRLSVIGGYSYLDAEFSSSARYQGNTPANVPEHKLALMLNYAHETDFGLWNIGLGYNHVRGRKGDNDNSFSLPDYDRFDFNVGWERDGHEVQFRVENILDKDYVSGSSGAFLDQGRPRTISVNYQRLF